MFAGAGFTGIIRLIKLELKMLVVDIIAQVIKLIIIKEELIAQAIELEFIKQEFIG